MGPQILDDIYRGFHDHVAWCRECLSIRDLKGQTVPLELWPAQLKLHKAIQRQRELGRPVRIVYLKARRVSVSVGGAAEIFHQVPFLDGQHAMIIAHDLDSTKEIFEYCEQFESGYQPFRGVIGLPGKVKDDERILKWENGSYIRVATANNLKAGRAYSIRYLQLDEFAYYRDAQTLMTGLMQAVPEDPDTMVLVISTANGVGGPFYDLCQTARDPTNKTEWIFVFFAWHEHPDYTRPLEIPADLFERSLSKSERYGDEPAERVKYNLTLEQLNWRRWAIDNKCGKCVRTFRQEYPGCPEEAFLTSGQPRFSHEALGRMAIIRDPIRGQLSIEQIGLREKIIFLPDGESESTGELAIYRMPERNKFYVLGADCASGKDINDGKGSEDRDYSVATVIDIDTGEQVAKYRKRIEPAPFGELVDTLGRFYHFAFLVPEANTWGIGTLEELLRRGYPLSHIYSRERSPSDRQTTSVHKIGWETNVVTREQMISALDMAIREYSVKIRDANTLQECLTFVKGVRGKAEGQQGCHDDEVFALGLAVVGLNYAPRVRPALERMTRTNSAPSALRYRR